MIIYNPNGDPLLKVYVDDSSYRYREIMSANQLVLNFALTEHVEIPVGSYCFFSNDGEDTGERYEVLRPEDVKLVHRRDFEYTLTLDGALGRLGKYKLHNMADGRLKFDYTATPREHVKQIVDNLNEREAGMWAVGPCLELPAKVVSYNHNFCNDALASVADVFETEFDVYAACDEEAGHDVNYVTVGMVSHNEDSPLSLSYGKNNGFLSNVRRTNLDDVLRLGKVYVQGGDRNIDFSRYPSGDGQHSRTLLLPRDFTKGFDGEFFEGESGYDADKAVTMRTDSHGFSVSLVGNGFSDGEDSLDCTDVYPMRVGKVTAVRYKWHGAFYDSLEALETALNGLTLKSQWDYIDTYIFDDTIPDGLDYYDCLIAGAGDMKLIFQTGMLAGREFSVAFDRQSKRRFLLKNDDFDGQEMPYPANWLPSVLDEYAVFNVMLPEAYLAVFNERTGMYEGAEYDMLRKACRYLYERKDARYTFVGDLDGIWAKRNWETISSKIVLGGRVDFSDTSLSATPFKVRISSIKQPVNNPHSPVVELSNEFSSGSFSSNLRRIDRDLAHIDEQNKEIERRSNRAMAEAENAGGTATPFRGEFDAAVGYYGTTQRCDIVKYTHPNEDGEDVTEYYKALPTVGRMFEGVLPTDTDYWMPFGASYENLATGFLFAEEAVIEKAVVRILRTADLGKRIVAARNMLEMYDAANDRKLLISGEDMTASMAGVASYFGSQSVVNATVSFDRQFTKRYESDGITISTQNGARVVFPAMTCHASVAKTEEAMGAFEAVYIYQWMVDGEVLDGTPLILGASTVGIPQSGELYGRDITLGSGEHTIKLVCTVMGSPAGAFGTGNVTLIGYADCQSDQYVRVNYDGQGTEIGANGFRVKFDANHYVEFSSNGGVPTFIMMAGNYGLRLGNDGLKKTSDGTNWGNI